MTILRFTDLWKEPELKCTAGLYSGQGYTPSLGNGATVLPSPTTYQQYSILAGGTVQLSWPVDNFPANANVVAELMAITPLGNGCVVQMPQATSTSLGEKSLFFNAGSVNFNVIDSVGTTIISIPSGVAYYIALVDNTAPNGVWLTFQFGAGTSSANAAALAGAGLSANGIFLQQVMAVRGLNTDYTVGAPDRDLLLNWLGGAGTLTLPLAASVSNNFYIQVRNSGSGALAVTPGGSDTINGNAGAFSFAINDSAFLVTDGVGWFTIGLGTINTNVFNFQIANLAGQTGTYILPSNLQGKVAYRFTGALAGNTIIQVPSTIQQYWVDNECTGGTLAIGTSTQIAATTQFAITFGARFILYCDGNNVLNADTAGLAVPLGISQGGTGAVTAGAALTSLGGTAIGVAVFTAASAAVAQGSLQVRSQSDSDALAIMAF